MLNQIDQRGGNVHIRCVDDTNVNYLFKMTIRLSQVQVVGRSPRLASLQCHFHSTAVINKPQMCGTTTRATHPHSQIELRAHNLHT